VTFVMMSGAGKRRRFHAKCLNAQNLSRRCPEKD
jgi:hypothetical protein